MKPLQLKIKGLNSFIDEQVIDFRALSEGNLFGIFGPTGSGKSSILDGITLALYGKVPRAGGQLSGIVNTQTDTVQVVFEFALGMGEQRRVYQVQRNFKRSVNRKSGNAGVSTKAASLYDMSEADNPRVLFEGQREVNAGVEALIGLNAEDFTRSVVLPQGSFSDFLKMTGADRGQMLERIFALEDYGEKMTARIKQIKGAKYLQMVQMESLLSAYTDVSAESMDDQVAALERLRTDSQRMEGSWRNAEEDYQKYKAVWEWQEELKLFQQKAAELSSRKSIIFSQQEQLTRAEQAALIKPLLERLEQREHVVAARNSQRLTLGQQLAGLNEQLVFTRKNWEAASQKKDLELPVCRARVLQLERGIKIAEEISLLQVEYDTLRQQYQLAGQTLAQQKAALEQKQSQITSRTATINTCQQKLEALKISPELREKLIKAYEEERKYQQELKQQEVLQQSISQLDSNLQDSEKKLQSLLEQYHHEKIDLERLAAEKQILEQNCPGHKDDLLNLQQKINSYQQEITTLAAWLKDEKSLREELAELHAQQQRLSDRLIKEREELKQQETGQQDCQQRLDKSREKNLALVLAGKLTKGEACPVCGSTHHPHPVRADEAGEIEALEKEKLDQDQLVQAQQNRVRQVELELRVLADKYNYQEQALKTLQGKIAGREPAELQELAQSQTDLFNKLKADINKWEVQLKDTDNKLIILKEQLARSDTEIATLQTVSKKDSETLASQKLLAGQSQQRLAAGREYLQAIHSEPGWEQVEERYRQMQQNDRQTVRLEKELKTEQLELNQLETERLLLQEECNKLDLSRTETATRGQEKRHLLDQRRAELENICGEEDPHPALEVQQKAIADIEAGYQQWHSSYELQKEQQEQQQREYSSLEGDLRALEKVLDQERREWEQSLKQYGFHEHDEVCASFKEESEIMQLRQAIQEYNDSLTLNVADINRIEQKLNGLSIAEEEWQKLQSHRQELQESREDIKNQLLLQEAAHKELEKRWAARQELDLKKAVLDQEYGLIEDLENLFKGKKFVEYIARTQLNHIAREASVKLKDITRGRYALELSAEGDFIMRDDFNGGVRRATHTLSGGETFLTSLALALALSTHIQLGRASLEFFFLDEGFGTLDAETLETVIDALENLRSEKLVVGVISHVEELKQRVPRRLIVTQAVPGVSGSTVSIE